MGIDKIKSVLAFPLSLHMAVDKAQADGKINLSDLGYATDPIMKLIPAVRDAKEALSQVRDLDDQEQVDLQAWAKTEYDIANDVLEEKIEAGIDVMLSISVLVGKLTKAEAEEIKAA